MKKSLLLYANYFYPEVASTAQIYTELCEGLVDKFNIMVICAVPCYTGIIEQKYKDRKYYYEDYNGVKIIRVRVPDFTKENKVSRVKHILSYFFNSIWATFKVGRQDLVFTVSQPPILGGILGTIGKMITRGKLIYNVQDFNPEQTIAVKYAGNKLLLNTMLWFDKRSCKKADLIITVGRDMQKNLENRFENKKVPPNIVINNWINETSVYPLEKTEDKIVEFKEKYQLENKFVIMSSGNIGLYYDFENIIKIAGKYKDDSSTVFAFVGDGAIKSTLEEYCQVNHLDNVIFIPYQDKKDLIYSLNAADVHIVTNAKGIKGVSVPSKIYGVLAANIPILGILEPETEAWKIIEESDCGILCEAGNYDQIEKAITKIIEEKYDFVDKHSTGRAYLVGRYTKDKSIEMYSEALENLA
ncbi:MAG: glycosyltransferase WbuB [Oscillospiraceae bacterium]|jgi:glycosyltransferase involved in cell wall biosynthesis|nr:glycosyltransferase WbuB [Oscillospiraceae bacterium]